MRPILLQIVEGLPKIVLGFHKLPKRAQTYPKDEKKDEASGADHGS